MKNKKLKLTIATLTCAIAFNSIALATNFSDTKNHWAEKNINSLSEQKIINGYEDGTFKPNNNITRAEVSKIFSSYIGEKEVENDKLSDIENLWSTRFIKHLVSEELITGYEDGTFKPNNNITRAEFATIAYKYLEKENKLTEGEIKAFTDTKGHWAEKSINALTSMKILNGYADGTFKPNSKITRAEVSKVIDLFNEKNRVEEPKEPEKEPEKPVEPEKPKEDGNGGVSLDDAITNKDDFPYLEKKLVEDVKVYYQKLPVQLNEEEGKIIEFAFMGERKTSLAFVSDKFTGTPQLIFLKGNRMVGTVGIVASDPLPGDKNKWVYRAIDGDIPELWAKSDSIGFYHSRESDIFIIPKTEIKSTYERYGWD